MLPLVEKYGVKIVFSGHTHIYERSLKNDVHYVIGGLVGGRFIRSTYKRNTDKQFLLSNTGTFTLVSVTKKYIRLKTYDEVGNIVDTLNINLQE